MAFKLTKAESTSKANHVTALQDAWEAIEEAKQEAQTTIAEAIGGINAALEAYENKRGDAASFAEEVAARFREEFDNRSEGWQGGDAGSEAESFISEWESVDLPELEAIEAPELEIEEPEHAATLEALPEEKG